MYQTPTLRILVLLTAVISATHAHAQNADAEGLFAEGDRLMTRGQFAQACDAFEASNRIEPRAGTLVRLGECRELNHQIASAWSAYKDALTRAKDPRKREIAITKAAALEPRLSYLTVSVPEESRVDGLEIRRNGQLLDRGLWNRSVPIDGGTYMIGGRAPGHEEWTATIVVPLENGKVSVDVPKFKELLKLVEPAKPAVAHDDDDEERDTSPSPSRFTRKRKLAIGLGAAGVVGLATGVVLGLQARNKQEAADALCSDPSTPCRDAARADDQNRAAHRLALGADIAFGVGAGLAIAAGVLWFTGAPETHRTLAVHVTDTEAGFAIGGSF
jgi:hypothetical protein